MRIPSPQLQGSTVKRLIWGLAALALLLSGVQQANAGIINGGFETEDLTGWAASSAKLVSVVDLENHLGSGDAGAWTATQGDDFAYLLTGAGTGVYTMLSQNFSASAGDPLSFDVFFDSGESSAAFNDNGYAKIVNNTTSASTLLFYSDVAAVGSGNTGWVHVTYTIPSADSYHLEFGVANEGDNTVDSAVGVDNVVLSTPEPGSLMLFSVGLCGLVGYTWTRRKRLVASAVL